MKRIITLCLLAFAPAFALGQGTNKLISEPDAKLTHELIALHQTWLEARKRGDTDMMSRLMADEWKVTLYTGGIVTRERSLAAAKAGNWKDRPIATHDNIEARAYGDTAVLTFRSKTEDGYVQTVQVWVKRQGRWQNVAGQSTKLAEQRPQ
jgi:hypothetical protein